MQKLYTKYFLLVTMVFPVILAAGNSVDPPLISDRPDQTESAVAVPVNYLQIESGLIWNEDAQTIMGIENKISGYSLATTLIRYGALKGFELRLTGEYQSQQIEIANQNSTFSGLAGISIGAKTDLSEESGGVPQMAIIAALELPWGEKNLKPAQVEPELVFCASHTLSEKMGLGYNFGAVSTSDNVTEYFYSLVFGYELSNALAVYGETFGSFAKSVLPAVRFDSGLTYGVTNNFQLDFSFGLALNEVAEDYFISSGLVIRFPDK